MNSAFASVDFNSLLRKDPVYVYIGWHVRKKIGKLLASKYFSQIARNQYLPFLRNTVPKTLFISMAKHCEVTYHIGQFTKTNADRKAALDLGFLIRKAFSYKRKFLYVT